MNTPSSLRIVTSLLAVTAFLFTAQQISWLSVFRLPIDNMPFYGAFLVLGCCAFMLIAQQSSGSMIRFARGTLSVFFPVEIFFIVGMFFSHQFHFLAYLSVGLYIILAFSYQVSLRIRQEIALLPNSFSKPMPKKHTVSDLLIVFFITMLFFLFGLSNLTRFAAVDEPLWTDGRITRFWKNLSERDLDKTRVSDKPGITVAITSGPGLLFATPKDYRDTRLEYDAKHPGLDIQRFYLAFRLPQLMVITFLLPFFYFLLKRLIGKNGALYSYAFIALSPQLIGISKIVNPDSLLWVFAPLSVLAYFVFHKEKSFRTLILSGIFLGLALLTKYVANFLLVFFFGYIFLRYILIKNDTSSPSFARYFTQELTYFGIWLGTGLSAFYLLFPAMWIEPKDLIESTLLSQAFEKVAPLFVLIIALVLIDKQFLSSRVMTTAMTWIRKKHSFFQCAIILCFAFITGFTLLNGITGMPWIDFVSTLSSPKSTYQMSAALEIFLTNFYPLLFGIPALALFGVSIALFIALQKDSPHTPLVVSLLVFILLYSLGSTVNQVALINRYQIMLYPLLSIVAGIGFAHCMSAVGKRFPRIQKLDRIYRMGSLFVIAILVFILTQTPFPMSFASDLLPKSYTVDIKDMGSGSYEAAQYLNALPDAKNTVIWTDKRGICKFFTGVCIDGFDFTTIPPQGLDYVVVSTGRESRTERMMANPYLLNDQGLIRFDAYYEKTDPVWELLINHRPGQFVRIFRFDSSL